MKVAVIGGGINGLACAWRFSEAGHQVTLFEADRVVGATSRASSKLLHGGLRYLEQGEFSLVREALAERDNWLKRAPHLAKPLPLIYPLYRQGSRPRWKVAAGMRLYQLLAMGSTLPAPKWMRPDEIAHLTPELRSDGLMGGYQFYDAQMDDYALGVWVAEQYKKCGGMLREGVAVSQVSCNGGLTTADGTQYHFDRVINAAGPWAERLLAQSGIASPIHLDLVRGSHLVVDRPCKQAYLLEVPGSSRIFFVLPWQGKMLLGTTEVRQGLDEPISCSEAEKEYLVAAYNQWFVDSISSADITDSFAGLRPLLYSSDDPSRATREYAIRRTGSLINVFGGKWTTSYALAGKVLQLIN